MSVHVLPGVLETMARCYDLHGEEMRTLVEIDLLAFLPWNYGQELEDAQLPSWQFVSEAMRSCAQHKELLWQAWEDLKDDLFS